MRAKPQLNLVLVGQDPLSSFIEELQKRFGVFQESSFQSPNRVYRYLRFSREIFLLSAAGALLIVSAKRSVDRALRADLIDLRQQYPKQALPVVVYLDDCYLYQDDTELLDLVENEIREALVAAKLSPDETPILRGDASAPPNLSQEELPDFLAWQERSFSKMLEALDEHISIPEASIEIRGNVSPDAALFTQALLSLCQRVPSFSIAPETVIAKVDDPSYLPIPQVFGELLRDFAQQVPKRAYFKSGLDWRLFTELAKELPQLPLSCGLTYSYQSNDHFLLVDGFKLGARLFGSGYEIAPQEAFAPSPAGISSWQSTGFSFFRSVKLGWMLEHCNQSKSKAVSYFRLLTSPRISWIEHREIALETTQQLLPYRERRSSGPPMQGTPKGTSISGEVFLSELRGALPTLTQEFFLVLHSLLIEELDTIEIYRWTTNWSVVFSWQKGASHLWSAICPKTRRAFGLYVSRYLVSE